MRLLLGLILGAILTVGAAYVYDSHNAVAAANGSRHARSGRWSTGTSSRANGSS